VTGRQSGFTYIAVLIAVAIMGAMLAALGTIWHTMVQRDNEKDLLFAGHQFRVGLNRYHQINQRYPMRLDDLVQDQGKPTIRRHLRKIYIDPMTRQTDWGLVKLSDGQIVGVYSKSSLVPLKKTGFRLWDMNLEGKASYSEWLFMAEGQTVASNGLAGN